DPSDVLGPILRRKTEIGIEAAADVVAVEDVDQIAFLEQAALDLHGDRGFAGAREPGEPQHPALVSVAPHPGRTGHAVGYALQVARPHRDALALIGIAIHVDQPATDDIVAVGEHEPPGPGD